jgi:hypothetical protein
LRQFVLDGADDAETEVANVHTKRMLWLLYHVNVLVDVLVLDIEFRQLLNVVELELLASGRSLHVIVGDAPRRCCDKERRLDALPRDYATSTADATAALAEVVTEVSSQL